MEHNGFAVRIVGGTEDDSGYVECVHGEHYSVELSNGKNVPCDAVVTIDGKDIGTFRIEARSRVRIERPSHDNGKLTFYQLGTVEAKQAGLVENDALGLVSVKFMPEKVRTLTSQPKPYYPYTNPWGPYYTEPWRPLWHDTEYRCLSNTLQEKGIDLHEVSASCAGGTGLSGRSDQQFYTVPSLDYDPASVVTIHVRLIAKKEEPRPLNSANSTPIPPLKRE